MNKELQYANKMLRKVTAWKKGIRTMVTTSTPNKNFAEVRIPARDLWGDPNAKVSTGKSKKQSD